MRTYKEIAEIRLKELGIGAIEAATAVGMERTYIRDLVEGRKKSVRQDKVQKLAEALLVSAEALSRNEIVRVDPKGRVIDPADEGLIPLLSWVSAGAMKQDHLDEPIKLIAVNDLPAGDWFALRVDGMSMSKVSPPNSIIFVNRKDTRLVPNACYVIGDPEGNATYKRWRPGPPPRFEPAAYEGEHETFYYENEPLIVGRVFRTMLDLN